METEKHKAGFVTLVGCPNVGKSTLMNALVGERLSIITPKAQTTRTRILGIISNEDCQVIFSDTPGILDPKYALQANMMKAVFQALDDADIVLIVEDSKTRDTQLLMESDETISTEKLRSQHIPIIVVLNKIDLATDEELRAQTEYWNKHLPNASILKTSALRKRGIIELFAHIVQHLPNHPPYYDQEALTDKPERFFVAEIIREKILMLYQREVPYSCEIVVEEFKVEKAITRIRAIIIVMRNSQKAIIIGKQGKKIKQLGTLARKDIEVFIDGKVFLELYVKVIKDWRNSETHLNKLGYT